jgi:WD40 repeat protein
LFLLGIACWLASGDISQTRALAAVLMADGQSAQDTGKVALHLQTGFQTAISVAFSPDGRFVLTGNEDGTARLWETTTGRVVRHFEGTESGVEGVLSAVFSADGKRMLSASLSSVRLWNVETGEEVWRFQDPYVGFAAFSPDERLVLSGGAVPRLLDVSTGREIRRFAERFGVTSLAFLKEGHRAVTVTGLFGANLARLWNLDTGQEILRFEGHGASLYSVAVAPDGRTVLTASADRTARLWDVSSGLELRRFVMDGPVHAVVFTADSAMVWTAGYDNTLGGHPKPTISGQLKTDN